MKKNLLLLATAAVAISCAESGIEESAIGAVKGTTISVNVALPGDDNATRIAISEDTESGDWITSWVDTDCLAGWSVETDVWDMTKFEMVGETDGVTANFEGEIIGEGLRLVYPYREDDYRWSYYYASQSVAIGSFDHMTETTFMISERYIDDVALEGNSCTMKHIGAAMELALRFEGIADGAEVQIVKVVMSGEDINAGVVFDMAEDVDSDNFITDYSSGSYVLNISENSVVNYDGSDATTYSVPFNIAPFSIEPDQSITFDVYVDCTIDGTTTQLVKSVESQNTTSQSVTFARGTISCINKIIDMSDAADDGLLRLSDFSATQYPTDSDTWVIGGITAATDDFAGLIDAFGALESGRQISLVFPNLEIIPANVFRYCGDALVSVSTLKAIEIESSAFYLCSGLTTLDISSVTEIGTRAFNGCDNLTTLNLESPNYIFEDGVIYTSDKSTIVSALSALVVGECSYPSVTTILDSAFSYCSNLTSISMPQVEVLPSYAFYECDILSNVDLDGVKTIERYAFFSCGVLEAVTFPNATTVGEYAFLSCSSLSQVNLPAVISIEGKAFTYCSLKDLTIATDENTKLEYVDTCAFSWWQPTGGNDLYSISLTIGSANSEYIDDVTLSVGDFIGNFGRIIVVDGNGDVVSDSDDATDSDDSDIELISGGDFEDGESANVYAVGYATSEISADGGVDGSAALKVTNPEVQNNVWDAQIMIDVTAKKAFDATDKFIVSFDVRSDDGVAISDAFLQAPGYGSYYNGSINNSAFTATSSWTNISYELSASTISEASLFESSYIIALNFGYSAGTIYIDNVSVERVVD